MSYSSQGEGWWQASNGRWYPPERRPPGWWKASNGNWYPPQDSASSQAASSEDEAHSPETAPEARGWGTKHLVVVGTVALVVGALIGAGLTSWGDGDDSDSSASPTVPVGEVSEDDDGGDSGELAGDTEEPVATTPSPTSTTTGRAEEGTREMPIPRGEEFTLPNGWTLKVTSFDSDAGPEIAAENEVNSPPPRGEQFAMATVKATYNGSEQQATAWLDINFGALGPSDLFYTTDDYCGIVPNALEATGAVLPGDSVRGNVCWVVDRSDADELVMTVEDWANFDRERIFADLER